MDRMFLHQPIEKSLWKSSFGPAQAGERIEDNGDHRTKGSCQPRGGAGGGGGRGELPDGSGHWIQRGESGQPLAEATHGDLQSLEFDVRAFCFAGQTPSRSAQPGVVRGLLSGLPPSQAPPATPTTVPGLCPALRVVYGEVQVSSRLSAGILPSIPPVSTSVPVFLEPASQGASLPPGAPPSALTLPFQSILNAAATLHPIRRDPQPQHHVRAPGNKQLEVLSDLT